MTFDLEKNIPLPKISRAGHNSKYPFSIMEVGDSFFVPEKTAKAFTSTVAAAGKRLGDRRFACRTVEGGVRVWRIE